MSIFTKGGGGGLTKTGTFYNSVASSIPNNVYTPLKLDSDLNDANNWHDPASANNERIYLPEGFEYQVVIQNFGFVYSAAGYRLIGVYDSLGNPWNIKTFPIVAGSVYQDLIAQRLVSVPGVYIYAQAWHNAGVALNTTPFYKVTVNQIVFQ